MGTTQLHNRLNTEQVKDILKKYFEKQIKAKQARVYLGLKKSQFFTLAGKYEKDPNGFTIEYGRRKPTRRLKEAVKETILKELEIEKKIILNPAIPTRWYNYSYVKQILETDHNQHVSLPTIISLAKQHGYYKEKRKSDKKHDREVITNFVGELIQHDSSHHLFAPDSGVKWYLITSLDDYSRRILYGDLIEVETSWAHIMAVEYLCLHYGIPFTYYVDQHRIFRYVKDRDTPFIHNEFTKFTDDVDPQWRQVLKELMIDPRNALSPQAKGKIERPYGWLQDHLVRTCVREEIRDITKARGILREELYIYNCKRIHSTTGEIPIIRFNRAVKEGKTLFRPFAIPKPYESTKDIFALRLSRMTDGYRTVSVKGTKLKVPHGECYVHVELRMYPNFTDKTVEVRFWQEKKFLGSVTVSLEAIPIVHF